MKYTLYTLNACEELIDKYVNEFGGTSTQIEDGILGLGTLMLHGAPNKKSILIKETFINSWTSGHSVTMYNKIPKKYNEIISK
jgi:hypothetical protein